MLINMTKTKHNIYRSMHGTITFFKDEVVIMMVITVHKEGNCECDFMCKQ